LGSLLRLLAFFYVDLDCFLDFRVVRDAYFLGAFAFGSLENRCTFLRLKQQRLLLQENAVPSLAILGLTVGDYPGVLEDLRNLDTFVRILHEDPLP
jgi:hypothetical protein